MSNCMNSVKDEQYIKRAIDLAALHSASGINGPFGAVIVRNNQVVSEGWNQVVETSDPTAHAEIMAIRKACEVLGTVHLDDCVIYSSCEPCPMCLAAICWAHLAEVYFSATRFDAKAAGFDDAQIYHEVCKPLNLREIPCTQLLPKKGIYVFTQWIQNSKSIQY